MLPNFRKDPSSSFDPVFRAFTGEGGLLEHSLPSYTKNFKLIIEYALNRWVDISKTGGYSNPENNCFQARSFDQASHLMYGVVCV